jgi:cytochrome P460
MSPYGKATTRFDFGGAAVTRKRLVTIGVVGWLAVLGFAVFAQDKYAAKVPGGLAMSEFRGYEGWHAIGISRNDRVMAMILGNPVMIDAYRAGIPANGKPVPDGAMMAKVHWKPKQNVSFPETTGPGDLQNVDFMLKDSKRFADSGGWGYAVFDYNAASDTFGPGTTAGTPPQRNDAKCGFACHTRAKARDYVFTEYGKR